MKIAAYHWPGQTQFGFGAVNRVGDEARRLGANKKVFIVTDRGIIDAGLVNPLRNALSQANLEADLFSETPPNPDAATVDQAAANFRASGAELIIGLGGGSAIDAAKAVRIIAGGPAEAKCEEYALMLGDDCRPLPNVAEMPPMIAIPTTAGTGAEVTPWAVITNEQKRQKFGVGGAAAIPSAALLDPALTLTLPPKLTAATGMDALTHLIEAYVSLNDAPIALDPMILAGIKRVGRYLRIATAQPNNQEARQEMLLASMLGGIAISSRWLGACHALAHQLSSIAGVHHGLACAMMLPPQISFSLPGAQERYAHIAQALDPSPNPGTVRDEAARAVTAVRDLMIDLGLPLRLREVGVTEGMIPELADNAILDLNWTTNPRPIDRDQMAQLYEEVY